MTGKAPWVLLVLALAVSLAAVSAPVQMEDLAERFVCVYHNSAEDPVPSNIADSWNPPNHWLVDEVPFYRYMRLVQCDCGPTEVEFLPCRMSEFIPDIVGVFSRLHVLSMLTFAVDLPDGYVAAQFVITYGDGDQSVFDLVAGENTAESRCNEPYNQGCLGHTPVAPALPVMAYDNAGRLFYNHLYHAAFDLMPKAIVSIEARVPATSCSPRTGCNGEETSALRVIVDAMTLER